MDISKMPAPAIAPSTAPAGAARTPGTPAAAAATDQGPQSALSAAPIADRADIRPLDLLAALQILLAEVRAAFELQAIAMGEDAGAPLSSPPQAAHALLQMLIDAMPDETASVPVWTHALTRAETAVQTGLDRGIEAVALWRDVPAVVVDAAKDTRTLVFSMLGDDPQTPSWLPPEWAGLKLKLQRFRRRRRLARRLLRDPDYSPRYADDDSEQRS